jgi:hypothetical protein
MIPLASDLLPFPGQMRREGHLKLASLPGRLSSSGRALIVDSFIEVSRGRKRVSCGFHVDNVRFAPESGHRSAWWRRPLSANSGHQLDFETEDARTL